MTKEYPTIVVTRDHPNVDVDIEVKDLLKSVQASGKDVVIHAGDVTITIKSTHE